MTRRIGPFLLGAVLSSTIVGPLLAQQPQSQFQPFVLTADRANTLARLPLTPDTRNDLLALLQQWSAEEVANQKQTQLAKQIKELQAKVDEAAKAKKESEESATPKTDAKP